jgi:hypothetical protein
VRSLSKLSSRLLPALLAAVALIALATPAAAGAASREPLSLFHEELREPEAGLEASARTDPRALARSVAAAATVVSGDASAPQIRSNAYGPAEVGSVLATLEALPHGPEMAQLSVLVATPEEIASICGEAVLACYFPGQEEMVVSGDEAAAAGVPRSFAIAHEYGHHVANVEGLSTAAAAATGEPQPLPPLSSGTIRWATYERVCQLTRAGRLFPGDQGAHYWDDPEEAFAETYAQLADPAHSVSWQFTPLLAPSRASLEKVRSDLLRPWGGPVTRTLSGNLAAPPAGPTPATGGGPESIAGARAVGTPPWVAERRLRTPLDGRVAVTVTAPAAAELVFSLHESGAGRVLAHGRAAPGQSAEIGYSNCGRDDLILRVRSRHGAGTFEAIVRRP